MSELKRKAAFTALLTPCIVGHHDTNLLFISSLSTTMGFFIWLLLLPSMSSVSFDGFTDADNPPITYCLKTAQEALMGKVCLIGKNDSIVECGMSLIRFCTGEEWCLPSLRFCGSNEETNDMLIKVVNPIICGLLVASLLITILTQWLSNFLNLYKITKFLTGGKGYMHRSLICTLVEDGNHKMLERLFQDASDVKEMICRPNRYGDTPLHISCRQKDEISTRYP